MAECGFTWDDCETTEADHECDLPEGHSQTDYSDHHCGWCGEEIA